MSGVVIILLLALNFGISWWNAYVAGQSWIAARSEGGWARVVIWSAAVQSACGFTLVFAVLMAFGLTTAHVLPAKAMGAVMDMAYLLIILPILGSGLIITAQSWISAFRRRSFGGGLLASYNTFAMASDAYNAFSGIPEAFRGLQNLVGSEDDDPKGMVFAIVVGLVVASLFLGVLLTRGIIFHYAGRDSRRFAYAR
jgi:hypothetical protein